MTSDTLTEIRIDADTPDGPMVCRLVAPNGGGQWPLVVLCHDGPGIRPAVHEVVDRLAGRGFAVVLPDLYHRQGQLLAFSADLLAAGDAEERRRMLATVGATGVPAMVDDVRAAARSARVVLPGLLPGVCGIVGFCHTARTVLSAMAEYPEEFVAGAALHPSFVVTDGPDSAHHVAGRIRGPLFLGFGGDDHSAPLNAQQPLIDELSLNDVPAEIEIYPGAGHGFTFAGPSHSPTAATRALDRITATLERALQERRGPAGG